MPQYSELFWCEDQHCWLRFAVDEASGEISLEQADIKRIHGQQAFLSPWRQVALTVDTEWTVYNMTGTVCRQIRWTDKGLFRRNYNRVLKYEVFEQWQKGRWDRARKTGFTGDFNELDLASLNQSKLAIIEPVTDEQQQDIWQSLRAYELLEIIKVQKFPHPGGEFEQWFFSRMKYLLPQLLDDKVRTIDEFIAQIDELLLEGNVAFAEFIKRECAAGQYQQRFGRPLPTLPSDYWQRIVLLTVAKLLKAFKEVLLPFTQDSEAPIDHAWAGITESTQACTRSMLSQEALTDLHRTALANCDFHLDGEVRNDLRSLIWEYYIESCLLGFDLKNFKSLHEYRHTLHEIVTNEHHPLHQKIGYESATTHFWRECVPQYQMIGIEHGLIKRFIFDVLEQEMAICDQFLGIEPLVLNPEEALLQEMGLNTLDMQQQQAQVAELVACVARAQEHYRDWYGMGYSDNFLTRGGKTDCLSINGMGLFTFWRHGSYGQERAETLVRDLEHNGEQALPTLVAFLEDDMTRLHRHSFASFLFDELIRYKKETKLVPELDEFLLINDEFKPGADNKYTQDQLDSFCQTLNGLQAGLSHTASYRV